MELRFHYGKVESDYRAHLLVGGVADMALKIR